MNNIHAYDAQADGINIEDIAANRNNRTVLRRMRRNNRHANDSRQLWIQGHHDVNGVECEDYVPEGTSDMGWLGYFIGKNEQLEELLFRTFTPPSGLGVLEVLEPFIKGV